MRPLDTTDPVGLPLAARRQRHLPAGAALDWLAAGWRDLWQVPLPSLSYGLMVFVVSILVVWGLFAFQLDAILFPALAGFMVAGPLIAIGLYQKSRDLEEGREPSLSRMVFVRAESGGQIWFTGAILCLLIMVWIRAAAPSRSSYWPSRTDQKKAARVVTPSSRASGTRKAQLI